MRGWRAEGRWMDSIWDPASRPIFSIRSLCSLLILSRSRLSPFRLSAAPYVEPSIPSWRDPSRFGGASKGSRSVGDSTSSSSFRRGPQHGSQSNRPIVLKDPRTGSEVRVEFRNFGVKGGLSAMRRERMATLSRTSVGAALEILRYRPPIVRVRLYRCAELLTADRQTTNQDTGGRSLPRWTL